MLNRYKREQRTRNTYYIFFGNGLDFITFEWRYNRRFKIENVNTETR